MNQAEFRIWLDNGIRNGWVSPPVCSIHDGPPLSATEEELLFYDGDDICVVIVRLYDNQDQRQAVEQNNCHCPAFNRHKDWRNQ